jgi:hypothetical protein
MLIVIWEQTTQPKSLRGPQVSAIGTPRVSTTVAEFKTNWSRYRGKESAAYQEHLHAGTH